jgi:hypothetical protein
MTNKHESFARSPQLFGDETVANAMTFYAIDAHLNATGNSLATESLESRGADIPAPQQT